MMNLSIDLGGLPYQMTSSSSQRLNDFFEDGTNNGINLRFTNPAHGSISVSFNKSDNTTDILSLISRILQIRSSMTQL